MESETLDKLYLEWSQFTKARTQREVELYECLALAERALRTQHTLPEMIMQRCRAAIKRHES